MGFTERAGIMQKLSPIFPELRLVSPSNLYRGHAAWHDRNGKRGSFLGGSAATGETRDRAVGLYGSEGRCLGNINSFEAASLPLMSAIWDGIRSCSYIIQQQPTALLVSLTDGRALQTHSEAPKLR